MINSYRSSSECLKKAGRMFSHLLAGHNEEQPIISQLQCGRCHRAGAGHSTLEVIGSKWSYALKWCKPCKPNNDDRSWKIYIKCNGKLLAASGAMHWNGVSRTMMIKVEKYTLTVMAIKYLDILLPFVCHKVWSFQDWYVYDTAVKLHYCLFNLSLLKVVDRFLHINVPFINDLLTCVRVIVLLK